MRMRSFWESIFLSNFNVLSLFLHSLFLENMFLANASTNHLQKLLLVEFLLKNYLTVKIFHGYGEPLNVWEKRSSNTLIFYFGKRTSIFQEVHTYILKPFLDQVLKSFFWSKLRIRYQVSLFERDSSI
jgi:hypothetical protein